MTKGLDYLHSHGVIHGDVKPVSIPLDLAPGHVIFTERKNNILINSNGDACLADFGFAIVTSAGCEETAHGHSALSAAPETLIEGRISKEADTFSYGLAVVEVSSLKFNSRHIMDPSMQIFKGEPPWGKATAAQVMTKITLGERPSRPEGAEALGLTTGLWNRLTNCWHEKPDDRITISQVLTFLTSTCVRPHIEGQMPGAYSRQYLRARAESVTVGALGSELSIGRATTSLVAGTQIPTSTRRRRSNTHSQPLDSRVLPQTTMTSRRSSRNHAGVTAEKSSEATGGTGPVLIQRPILTDESIEILRPKPAARAREGNNPKSFKSTLKRCKNVFVLGTPPLLIFPVICVPSCISEEDMVR